MVLQEEPNAELAKDCAGNIMDVIKSRSLPRNDSDPASLQQQKETNTDAGQKT